MTFLSAKKAPGVEKITKLQEGLGGLGEASPIEEQCAVGLYSTRVNISSLVYFSAGP